MKIEYKMMEVGEIKLNVGFAGPEDGEPLILLHGFPEFSGSMLSAFSELSQTYRLIAPDQRGYNLSDKPSRISDYTTAHLTIDIKSLILNLGYQNAFVICHDWGGLVGWELARRYPEVVKKLVVISAPQMGVFQKTLLTHPKQLLKSYYIGMFQFPWLPESLLGSKKGRVLRSLMRKSGHPAVTPELMNAWMQPRALTSMINWYRALLYRAKDKQPELIEAPTLILWGSEDDYLEASMAFDSQKLCRQAEVQVIEGASHWIHHTHSDLLNSLITKHLSRSFKE